MTLLEILRLVHPVSEQTAKKLTDIAEIRKYRKKERIVHQGKRCHSVYFVKSGYCRGVHENDGKEDTRWFAAAGDVLTSVTAWHTGRPALFSIDAISPVEVYVCSFSNMRRLFLECPDLKEWLIKVLLEQLYALEQRYIIIGTGDAKSRYEALLKGRPLEMINSMPLKYIAQYLGVTQETLSRVRASF